MHTDENKNNLKAFLKQWAPITSLVVLTISLMFFFKENRGDFDRIIEKGANNLVDFYTQNLKPLFTKTDLTNEDVFNFAMNKKLPVDKENKRVIQISDTDAGREIIEFQDEEYSSETNNVEKFANYYELNLSQKYEIDSILQNYQEDIYSSILYSDNNTLAISPKLVDLQQAILADLMVFARQAGQQRVAAAIPVKYEITRPEVAEAIKSVRMKDNKDFIFFTPDTIFSRQIQFDRDKLNEELKKHKVELAKVNKTLDAMGIHFAINEEENIPGKEKQLPDVFSFKIDTNSIRVVCPEAFETNIDIPEMEELRLEMENLKEEMKIYSLNITREVLNNLGNIAIDDTSGNMNNIKMEFDMDNLGSVIKESLKLLNNKELMNGVEINFDSLIQAHPELQEGFEIEDYQEEMRDLENELETLDEDI